nr:MAG TPA: hypothetical protein [Caudoviricetes sp.]
MIHANSMTLSTMRFTRRDQLRLRTTRSMR